MPAPLLFAQLSDDSMRLMLPLVLAAVPLLILLTMFFVLKSLYRRCASNQLLVVYGAGIGRDGATCRVMHGGGCLVLPIIQACEYISLEPIEFESNVRGVLSRERTRVDVTSQIVVAVGTEPLLRQNAANRLLNCDRSIIRKLAEEIVASSWQRVLAGMRTDEIEDRHGALLARFRAEVEPELNQLGLVLINVHVVDVAVEPSKT